jgi:hypothetical protein
MKSKFSRQVFEKILKWEISWKSVQREPSCSMRTDRHDEGNSRFSQYFANAPKNDLLGIIWEVCKRFDLVQDWCLEARFDTSTVQFRICTNRGIVFHKSKSLRINKIYVHKHRNITKCIFFITDFLINNSAQLQCTALCTARIPAAVLLLVFVFFQSLEKYPKTKHDRLLLLQLSNSLFKDLSLLYCLYVPCRSLGSFRISFQLPLSLPIFLPPLTPLSSDNFQYRLTILSWLSNGTFSFWDILKHFLHIFYTINQQMDNYFTNYHTTPTCFDTVASSSWSS